MTGSDWKYSHKCGICGGKKTTNLRESRHLPPRICCHDKKCGAQFWDGKWYTAKEWDTYINEE